jgi:hypothetical protein
MDPFFGLNKRASSRRMKSTRAGWLKARLAPAADKSANESDNDATQAAETGALRN